MEEFEVGTGEAGVLELLIRYRMMSLGVTPDFRCWRWETQLVGVVVLEWAV